MAEITKQIGEHFSVAMDFTGKLPANAALVSGVLLATRRDKNSDAVLAAVANVGDLTVTLDTNPLNGAALLVNSGQPNEESLLVTTVSGVGPYVATLASQVQLAHASNEPVRYEQGASALVLGSTVGTVSGTLIKANIVGGLIYHYTITFLATLSTGDVLREDLDYIVQE